jgi:signal transduction histidine kinase
MKLNISISLKLTLIVVAVSAAVIFSLTLYNINEQAISFENIYVDKARDASRLLDVVYSTNDGNIDISEIINRVNETKEIQQIDVYEKTNTTLQKIYSTREISQFDPQETYINLSIGSLKQCKIPQYTDAHYNLTVITPINASINMSGAYVFHFTIDESVESFEAKTNNLIFISTASLFILIFSFLFLLRKAIVKPIIHFRDTARTFGKGNLDSQVHIDSNDEIGELADAFNTMAIDLKASRDKIKEYNKILEQLLDQKDEFIGQLGHDLKNPLQSIVGLLPLLLEKEQDPRMKSHLEVLNSDAQYMKELILKTLELAKLRSQNIKFDFTTLDLQQLVKKTVENQKRLFEEHHISVENSISNQLTVYADALRIEEVIKNLLTNAVKYTPETGGNITISAEDQEDKVIISIEDQGLGMTPEQLDRIFDEFYRAHSTNVGIGSVGLGLSISKRIIEQHGGRIWAESKGPGKGSTFKFELKKNEKP